ncbi:MAG: thiol peroxidase [Acidobacteria bacterium]|nr:thiol peroxidase [Acidobacteriota bacterium]
MAEITLKGNPIHTSGELPGVGSKAPDFSLTTTDLSDIGLSQFKGKKVVLNIFPSVDTPVCATSVRAFNQRIGNVENAVVLCISRDLPFALKRFCGAEGLDHVISASEMRNLGFGDSYGIRMVDGPLAGLLGRAVVVVDEQGVVTHAELVPEIAQEPNYDAAMKAVS